MDHRERGKFVLENFLKRYGGAKGYLHHFCLAGLLRVLSPLERALPRCDVWMGTRACPLDYYGELEIKIGPCHIS
jgi:hypothetical protein